MKLLLIAQLNFVSNNVSNPVTLSRYDRCPVFRYPYYEVDPPYVLSTGSEQYYFNPNLNLMYFVVTASSNTTFNLTWTQLPSRTG